MHVLESFTDVPIYSLREASSSATNFFEAYVAEGDFRKHKANFLTPHRKDFYMFALVKKGDSRHWVDMVPYTLKPDTFYFSTPEQIHVKEKSVPFWGTMVMFSHEFLTLDEGDSLSALPIIQNSEGGHELTLEPNDLAFIEDLLQKIVLEYQSKNDYRGVMLSALIRVLLIYTSRLYNQQFNPNNSDRQLLRQFRSLLNANFCEIHEVATYAERLNVSAGYLGEAIKNQSGKSAIEHIHERLILEAKRLLFHTDYSVKEIAFQLGFEDPAYFNRFFRRLAQATPMEYRNTRKMYH